ncbi:hypothetical protein EVAR_88153_1 [Eumeta japonica]|uniref:Uncharacterized protein n=1 Tax=Eumeta variegata TaxID=151549 RepID=A0A4C1WSH5_EUMVA|nr:hypothetical protein EVAR_88153_1 [Eumeta japonica]
MGNADRSRHGDPAVKCARWRRCGVCSNPDGLHLFNSCANLDIDHHIAIRLIALFHTNPPDAFTKDSLEKSRRPTRCIKDSSRAVVLSIAQYIKLGVILDKSVDPGPKTPAVIMEGCITERAGRRRTPSSTRRHHTRRPTLSHRAL